MMTMMLASTSFSFNPLNSNGTAPTNNSNKLSCPAPSGHRRRHLSYPAVYAEGNRANNHDIEPSREGSVGTDYICTVSSSATAEERTEESGLMKMVERTRKQLGKVALATAMTGLLIFGPTVGDAMAAKSGGRVGGQAFRSPPPSGSRAPRIDNSRRSNIYINPSPFVAPPLYGPPYFGGGWGWSPFSFFAPGPSIAVEVGSGFNLFGFLLLVAFLSSILNIFRKRNDDDYYD